MKSQTLSDKDIREIYKLRTEGCPCCGTRVSCDILAEKYMTTDSTVSRIGNRIIVPSDEAASQNGAGPSG